MAKLYRRGGKLIGTAKDDDRRWYVQYFDHTGKRRAVSTGTTVYAEAKKIGDKLEAEAAIRRHRVIDPREEAIALQLARPLSEHFADYRAKLKTAGRSDRHVRDTLTMLRKLADSCGFETAGDIEADPVNRYAVSLGDLGRSARTVQSQLTAAKSFTKWLTSTGKLTSDPLLTVSKPNPERDRRLERRMLLHDEWEWLRTVTLAQDVESYGMLAHERVLLYATAIQTGLRSNELRSLTRGRLFLDHNQPFITCKARQTKNSKDVRQYIQSDLADDLRGHIATKAPKAPVFGMPHTTDMARMIRADDAAARQEWINVMKGEVDEFVRREQSDFLSPENAEGEKLDFHALRHTCGAWLAMTGAHPKAVQSVMRHSSITLTMDTYGHLFPGQEAETISRLPSMLRSPQPLEMRATGTDDEQSARMRYK